MLNEDIIGVERLVIGFNKTPDEDGNHTMEVKYRLKGITLYQLRKIFNVDLNSKDQAKLDIVNPLHINAEQAELLNPFVVDGQIDVNKYMFELDAVQAPGYDWRQGYAIKIES